VVTWNYDDGAPAIDVSHTYLVNPPNPDPDPSPAIQPRLVDDSAPHAFTGACLYHVVTRSSDDDGGSNADAIDVIITGNETKTRSHGYWKTQLGKNNYTASQKACFLKIIAFFSAVYNEKVDVSTPAPAIAAFTTAGTSDARRLMSVQLLGAWFNFASGALDPTDLVDTDGHGGPDTAFLTVINHAEAVYNNPASTRAQLLAQKDILERINLRDE
jgi:hypothetical protein